MIIYFAFVMSRIDLVAVIQFGIVVFSVGKFRGSNKILCFLKWSRIDLVKLISYFDV